MSADNSVLFYFMLFNSRLEAHGWKMKKKKVTRN